MVHVLTIPDDWQKEAILSGEKTGQVFLKSLCGDTYQVGDKIVFCHPVPDNPVAVAEVMEIRTCVFIEVGMDAWAMSGFQRLEQAHQYFYSAYPNLHAETAVAFVRWGAVERLEKTTARTHCEECDERDQT